MGSVSLHGVRKFYGDVEVIKRLDLTIADRELVVFVGPSGCGKSTLLRMIAGLENVDAGTVAIDDVDVTEVAPARRGLAMVFQNYALYPHMTAYNNMAYGLRRSGMSKADIDRQVRKAADILQIAHLLPRRPNAMSGGQRQRVAIGRAIVRNPKVFLFDEPLSNLDAALRVEMRMQIARLHQDLKATMIFVTHDQVEAMTLADRIVVLRAGAIEQVGTPLELYRHPRNLFVAGFIGSPTMNFLPASVEATLPHGVELALDGLGTTLFLEGGFPEVAPGITATLGVRPERCQVSEGEHSVTRALVAVIEHLGGESILHLVLPNGRSLTAKVSGEERSCVGDRVAVEIDPRGACLFGADGENLRLARDPPELHGVADRLLSPQRM